MNQRLENDWKIGQCRHFYHVCRMIVNEMWVSYVHTCFSKTGSSRHPPPPIPTPPHQKPLKTPCKDQKSRTPQARLTPASTPAPAIRIRYRAGSWSTACWHPVSLLFLSSVWNNCRGAGGKLRVYLLFENGVVTTSHTSHSNSPLPHPPPHQKPLITPCKNQKSRTS